MPLHRSRIRICGCQNLHKRKRLWFQPFFGALELGECARHHIILAPIFHCGHQVTQSLEKPGVPGPRFAIRRLRHRPRARAVLPRRLPQVLQPPLAVGLPFGSPHHSEPAASARDLGFGTRGRSDLCLLGRGATPTRPSASGKTRTRAHLAEQHGAVQPSGLGARRVEKEAVELSRANRQLSQPISFSDPCYARP